MEANELPATILEQLHAMQSKVESRNDVRKFAVLSSCWRAAHQAAETGRAGLATPKPESPACLAYGNGEFARFQWAATLEAVGVPGTTHQ